MVLYAYIHIYTDSYMYIHIFGEYGLRGLWYYVCMLSWRCSVEVCDRAVMCVAVGVR